MANNDESTPLLTRVTHPVDENLGGVFTTESKWKSYWKSLVNFVSQKAVLVVGSVLLFIVWFIFIMNFVVLKDEIANSAVLQLDYFHVDNVTDDGINLLILGNLSMNYSMIDGAFRRNVVRFGSSIVRSVDVADLDVDVYLDEKSDKDRTLLQAHVPGLEGVKTPQFKQTSVNTTAFVSGFNSPADVAKLVQRFLAAKEISFIGETNVSIHKGFLPLGTYHVTVNTSMQPEPEDSSLSAIKVESIALTNNDNGGLVDSTVVLSTVNNLPISGSFPPMAWDLQLEGCAAASYVTAATGISQHFELGSNSDTNITVTSTVHRIPDSLMLACRDELKSPLDKFVANFLSGDENRISIKGAKPVDKVPHWLSNALSAVQIVQTIPGRNSTEFTFLDKIEIVNFDIDLPKNPFDNRQPRITSTILITGSFPDFVQVGEQVTAYVDFARGLSNLSYEDRGFGYIHVKEWTPCVTTRNEDGGFVVEMKLDSFPLTVEDDAVFREFMREYVLKGSAPIFLDALVDVRVGFVEEIELTELPISGTVLVHKD